MFLLMLVWLNGAHGAGKTSVAGAMRALRPESAVIDPEQIGFMLRRSWPAALPEDFKDMAAWREMTLVLLKSAAAVAPGRLLIVPMTLANPRHFQEIVGGLQSSGVPLRHFTLAASLPTLRRRLRKRLDWPRSKRWALARAEECAATLRDGLFAEHIATDMLSVREVAEAILGRSGA